MSTRPYVLIPNYFWKFKLPLLTVCLRRLVGRVQVVTVVRRFLEVLVIKPVLMVCPNPTDQPAVLRVNVCKNQQTRKNRGHGQKSISLLFCVQ